MRLPLLIGLLMVLLGLVLDICIWLSMRSSRRLWRYVYVASAVLTNSIMILVTSWPKRSIEADILPIMWLLYTWITVYISKIVYCVCLCAGYLPRLWKRKSRPIGKYVGLPLGLLTFFTMWYGAIWGRRVIEVEQVTVSSRRLPRSFDGFRIVQFSDAHVGTWGSDTTFVSALVDKINSLSPDVVVFTGDVVNRKTDEILPFTSILSRLHAPYGVYSILGNHDYGDYANWPTERARRDNFTKLCKIQEDMGWRLLNNDHVWLRAGNDSIALIGVENWGEAPFPTYGNLDVAMKGLEDKYSYKVLLTHNPVHWHQVVRERGDIDLSLSGHTHAMQMRVRTPWKDYSLSALRYPEWQGLHEYTNAAGEKSHLYVNIGCGEVGFPARIGAAPELTVFTLIRKN